MENRSAATALNYFAYNFIKIQRTLRTARQWLLAFATVCGACKIW